MDVCINVLKELSGQVTRPITFRVWRKTEGTMTSFGPCSYPRAINHKTQSEWHDQTQECKVKVTRAMVWRWYGESRERRSSESLLVYIFVSHYKSVGMANTFEQMSKVYQRN